MEVAVLPVPNSLYGLCGRKAPLYRVQEQCESGGSRPGLPVPNNPCDLCGRKATVNRAQELCVKVEVAVLGSRSLIVPTVSVDVKQH